MRLPMCLSLGSVSTSISGCCTSVISAQTTSSCVATRLSAGGVADEWVIALTARRREGLQEVLADETADEARGAAEVEPRGERSAERFGTDRMSFATIFAQKAKEL